MKRLPFWKRSYGARCVLDIGAGHNPFYGATHLLEIDLQEGRERGGQQVHVPESTTLTVGDISVLPYRTGSFDYVYASHILEHVTDPIVACREVVRVGRAGYVETPAPFLEQGLALYDKTPPDQWFHRWFVYVDRQQRLVFEPKTPDEVDRFCSCRAGQFMKEFYDSVDFREAQHCFPAMRSEACCIGGGRLCRTFEPTRWIADESRNSVDSPACWRALCWAVTMCFGHSDCCRFVGNFRPACLSSKSTASRPSLFGGREESSPDLLCQN